MKFQDRLGQVAARFGLGIGNLVSLLTLLKGLPMTYNRDLQEDKERLFDTADTVRASMKQREEEAKYSAHRRTQIGSGGREEKIRTYNYPQNRITDHRIGLTLYNLDRVMEGDLGEMIQSLQVAALQERLKESSLAG